MKILAGIVAVMVAAWLQVSWFGHVRPLGVMPNLMLVVIVLFGLWSNATPALAAALGGGFLLDLASGSDFGLRMAFFSVVVLAIIAGRQTGLHADSFITALLVVMAGTVLYNLVVLATLGAPIQAIELSRIGRELVDNLVILGFLVLVRLNLPQRPSNTPQLNKGFNR
ncbi:MAG TPA: rod shape-determining protein MreD [Candidatus Saccharimonadales bacterium]|nr:rod shape-determining protein MreD [Candidatus Saccharimonadales bacterium]